MFTIKEVIVGVKGKEVKNAVDRMDGECVVPVFEIVNMGKLEGSENYAFEIMAVIPQDLIDLEKLENADIESLLILGIPKSALKQVVQTEKKSFGIGGGQSVLSFEPFDV